MHGIHVKVQIIVNKTNHNKVIIRAAIQLVPEFRTWLKSLGGRSRS